MEKLIILLHSNIKTQRIVQYDSPTCRIVKTVHHKETANNNIRSQFLSSNLCPAPSMHLTCSGNTNTKQRNISLLTPFTIMSVVL